MSVEQGNERKKGPVARFSLHFNEYYLIQETARGLSVTNEINYLLS